MIKFSRSVLLCSVLVLASPVRADIPVASRLVSLCEKALIQTGLLRPPLRALVVETDGLDIIPELASYHPSSYTPYFLHDLSYYPVRFLSAEYLGGQRVLDLNAGKGAFVEELRRAGIDAVGVSIRLSRYQLSKPHYIQASATRTGLPDRSADRVFATLSTISLFYQANPQVVWDILREAKRVLRKGGTLLISPIHLDRVNPWGPDVSPQTLLAGTVFARLPSGLRIKSAPDRAWLQHFRDAELDQGRPRRANYWLELERYD